MSAERWSSSNEQMAIYEVRSSAATRERILTATGIDLFCAFAAGLMLVSGSYSFVLCRRQLQKAAKRRYPHSIGHRQYPRWDDHA